MMKNRFPRSVFGEGHEPDPRFSLANERTFLAWIRTALGLFVAGVALEALDAPIQHQIRLASALTFIALGLLAALHSWRSWSSTERSLRAARPLPGLSVGAVISGGAALAIIGTLIGSFLA